MQKAIELQLFRQRSCPAIGGDADPYVRSMSYLSLARKWMESIELDRQPQALTVSLPIDSNMLDFFVFRTFPLRYQFRE